MEYLLAFEDRKQTPACSNNSTPWSMIRCMIQLFTASFAMFTRSSRRGYRPERADLFLSSARGGISVDQKSACVARQEQSLSVLFWATYLADLLHLSIYLSVYPGRHPYCTYSNASWITYGPPVTSHGSDPLSMSRTNAWARSQSEPLLHFPCSS